MKFSPKILLVDDHLINLEVLEVHLAVHYPQATIFKAQSAQQALKLFSKYEIDLVLLDLMLPDMNGLQLCLRMKNARQDNFLPIIMITALHDRNSLLSGLSAGADDFLTKPINQDELNMRVNNLLKLREATIIQRQRYKEISHELHMARELLNDFLPSEIPQYPHTEFDIIYEPCTIIGGDFYDILSISETQFGIFIADVKGHGAASAMMTALLKEQLYRLRAYWDEPDKLLDRINKVFCRFFKNTRNDYFITALYAVVDLEHKVVRWSIAGHPDLVKFTFEGGQVLEGERSLPLGILEDTKFVCNHTQYKERESILFYTDGLFELPLFYQEPRYFQQLDDMFDFLKQSGIQPSLRLIVSEIKRNVIRHDLSDDVNVIAVYF